jgi:hypothetical protein
VVVRKVDEELAVRAVWVLGPCCTDCAAIMWDARKLCFDVAQIGTACARRANVEILFHVAVGHIAGLRHETIDHTVETNIVICTRAREGFHALAVQRRNVGQQFDCDCAVFELKQNCVL